MNNNILKQYQDKDQLEVGLDEAGRGCLFGPVCIAGVSWLDKDPEPCIEIKDSKKCTVKHRLKCYDYIIDNAVAYSIQLIDNNTIDPTTLKGSWAGAFGNFQFMPTTINKYAIDYNSNSIIELKGLHAGTAIENLARRSNLNYYSITCKAKMAPNYNLPNQQGQIEVPLNSLNKILES